MLFTFARPRAHTRPRTLQLLLLESGCAREPPPGVDAPVSMQQLLPRAAAAPPQQRAARATHRVGATRCDAVPPPQQPPRLTRRAVVGAPLLAAAAAATLTAAPQRAHAAELTVDSDEPGFGTHVATEGDLLLVHYRGTLADTGATFDTTLGGAVVRTNGLASVSINPAVGAPRAVSLRADDVQPGVVTGLRTALLGMRVGGKRTVTVPPELGFGQTAVAAPYGIVPPGSTLRYQIEVLRLSTTGPDALLAGIAQCGIGGAAAQNAGCDAIEPRE